MKWNTLKLNYLKYLPAFIFLLLGNTAVASVTYQQPYIGTNWNITLSSSTPAFYIGCPSGDTLGSQYNCAVPTYKTSATATSTQVRVKKIAGNSCNNVGNSTGGLMIYYSDTATSTLLKYVTTGTTGWTTSGNYCIRNFSTGYGGIATIPPNSYIQRVVAGSQNNVTLYSILDGSIYNTGYSNNGAGMPSSLHTQGGFAYQIADTGGFDTDFITPSGESAITGMSIDTVNQTVTVTGFWNSTTTSGIYEQLVIVQNGLLQGFTDVLTDSYPYNQSDFNATSTGFFNFTVNYTNLATTTATTTTPITATSTVTAFIYQFDNNYLDPNLGLFAQVVDPRYKTTLASSTIEIGSYGYKIDTLKNLNEYPEYECGITSITGCIKNAGIWLFYPTKDLLDKFYDLKSTIETKPPAGYFTMVKSNLNNISATSTKKFTITIPASIKNTIFSPFDIAIAGVLWVMFIFSFYKRLKHITI